MKFTSTREVYLSERYLLHVKNSSTPRYESRGVLTFPASTPGARVYTRIYTRCKAVKEHADKSRFARLHASRRGVLRIHSYVKPPKGYESNSHKNRSVLYTKSIAAFPRFFLFFFYLLICLRDIQIYNTHAYIFLHLIHLQNLFFFNLRNVVKIQITKFCPPIID